MPNHSASGCSCAVPGVVSASAGAGPDAFVWLSLAVSFVALLRRARRRIEMRGPIRVSVLLALLSLCASCADRSAHSTDAGAGAGHTGAAGHGEVAAHGVHAGAAYASSSTGQADAAGDELDASAAADGAGQVPLGGEKLCAKLGWCALPNTTLASACADSTKYAAIQGYEGCAAVINDWSGAIADTKRNRLLLWGGGHHGYFGNELYALDLGTAEMRRLNDPSDISGIDLTRVSPFFIVYAARSSAVAAG